MTSTRSPDFLISEHFDPKLYDPTANKIIVRLGDLRALNSFLIMKLVLFKRQSLIATYSMFE